MIRRYVLHLEVHKGHWPRVSFRRAPRTGDVTPWGVLVLCPTCQDGFLAQAQPQDGPVAVPADDVFAGWADEDGRQ
jgi:hypothetical protein